MLIAKKKFSVAKMASTVYETDSCPTDSVLRSIVSLDKKLSFLLLSVVIPVV